MPWEELIRLEQDQKRITAAQNMPRENRRHLKSGEYHDMKNQLQKDALNLVTQIHTHKQVCTDCQGN